MSGCCKLILGTAQFGGRYGIKGDGSPNDRELERIARTAWDGGIRTIHTSWQYGLPKICEAIFSEFEWIRKDKDNPYRFRWGEKTGYALYDRDVCPGSVDIIQIPVNVLDKRFLNYSYGYEIHARSIFLQGLLLMEELPSWVQGLSRGKIKLFQRVCQMENYEPYEAALGWVLGLPEIDRVIIGANSACQLKQLLKVSPLKWDYDFSITDEKILDPRKWPV